MAGSTIAAGGPVEADVVVVGAGVAGIASAVTFAQRGLRVTLVEARPEIGGRARSWIDHVTKDPLHIGPHVVVSEYPNFFKLLEQLGTRHKIVMQPWRHFITLVKGTQEHHIRTQTLPAPASWAKASITDPFVTMADKHSTVPAAVHILSLSRDQIMELDNISGANFLRSLGVTEGYISHFWGFLSHAILNVPIDEVSAAAIASFFQHLVGRSNVEMGFSDGALGDLLTPARELLTKLGATVITGTEVESFLGDTTCTGVVIDGGRRVTARLGVVSTLPPQTLLPLLPQRWLDAHPSLENLWQLKPCKYICVYLWFDRKVTGGRQMWARTSNKNDLNCEFYDFTEIYTGSDSRGILWKDRPSFIGSNIIDAGRLGEITDEDVVQGTLRELTEQFPEVKDAKLVHWKVNRVPMAIHRPVVGTERLRPDQAAPVPGLYFAGCWTKTGFPCSMESAARGGYLAAERLLECNGLPGGVAISYLPMDVGARLVGKLECLRPSILNPFFRWLVGVSGGSLPSTKSKL